MTARHRDCNQPNAIVPSRAGCHGTIVDRRTPWADRQQPDPMDRSSIAGPMSQWNRPRLPYNDRSWPPDSAHPRSVAAWQAARRLLVSGPKPYPAVLAAMMKAGPVGEGSARKLIAAGVARGDLNWSGTWATMGRTVRIADGRPSVREGRRVIHRWE